MPIDPITLDELSGKTPDEIIAILDADWPWPLDAVQGWFEDLWNSILDWINSAKRWIVSQVSDLFDQVWNWIDSTSDWIVSQVSSLFNQVWDWIDSSKRWILSQVSSLFNQVWGWIISARDWIGASISSLGTTVHSYFNQLKNDLDDVSGFVADKVNEINAWFSNEFIDPFIDWLLQFPRNLTNSLTTMINGLGTRLESWLTHHSPGFPGVVASWWKSFADWFNSKFPWLIYVDPDLFSQQNQVIGGLLTSVIGQSMGTIFAYFPKMLDLLGSTWTAMGNWVLRICGPLGRWFLTIFSRFGGWIAAAGPSIGTWLGGLLPKIGGWFMSRAIPLLGAGGIITLEATGKLEEIFGNYVTPAITSVFDWFENQGPISPQPGKNMSLGITKLASFTVSGLAAMTLAGEALSPLKHIGMGHISAILYDLINYKTLTAAFMGVMAFVYIKQPLTYYYQRAARPNLPGEGQLGTMLQEYAITPDVYRETMQWHGYPDDWIEKLADITTTALAPRMLNNLAQVGVVDEELIDRALHHAGYSERDIPYLKLWLSRTAAGDLKTISVGTAMSRYQEGFDDERDLRRNLGTLGVAETVMDKYVFACQLKYLYDYQTELKTYYIDAYHRRDIEAPELRYNLAATGIDTQRIDLIIQAQKIKRLAAAKPAEDPAIAVQFDTIRDRRKKQLITRQQEVEQLVKIGKEMPYALAIADNDDVTLARTSVVPEAVVLAKYETEAGKIQVDTIRRLTRSGQLSSAEEIAALHALEMPHGLATAIADNDQIRIKKASGGD